MARQSSNSCKRWLPRSSASRRKASEGSEFIRAGCGILKESGDASQRPWLALGSLLHPFTSRQGMPLPLRRGILAEQHTQGSAAQV